MSGFTGPSHIREILSTHDILSEYSLTRASVWPNSVNASKSMLICVFGRVSVVDCGNTASDWLSSVLRVDNIRLVRHVLSDVATPSRLRSQQQSADNITDTEPAAHTASLCLVQYFAAAAWHCGYLLFRECCSRCRFLPCYCVIHFVE